MMEMALIRSHLEDSERIHAGIQLKESSDLGLHVVATADIPLGTVVIQTYGWMYPSQNQATDEAIKFILTQHKDSPINHEALLSRLHSLCPRSEPPSSGSIEPEQLAAKLNENSFDHGLYPFASYLNHSCKPNCCTSTPAPVPGSVVLLQVRTVAPIQSGEQLCISYLDGAQLALPMDQRQAQLAAAYRFTCSCIRCTAAPTDGSLKAEDLIQAPSPCCQQPRLPGLTGYLCTKCHAEAADEGLDAVLTQGFGLLQSCSMQTGKAAVDACLQGYQALDALDTSHWIKLLLLTMLTKALEQDCDMPPINQHSLRAQTTLLQLQGLEHLLHQHDYWIVKQYDVLVDALQAYNTLAAASPAVVVDQVLCDIDAPMLTVYERAVAQFRKDLDWWD
eukprot:m.74428 g.74428  ORF g.74428 m.74428 type:complete len:391 (-) comp14360_c0_seq1:153-1325(-)